MCRRVVLKLFNHLTQMHKLSQEERQHLLKVAKELVPDGRTKENTKRKTEGVCHLDDVTITHLAG